MTFNAISEEDFLNREPELSYLKGLPDLKERSLGGNVFLEGARGVGKTELLNQLHRALFREGRCVPFYYSFRTANLKGAYFAKDYFTRFVRQYVAFVKRDPSIALNVAEPLQRLLPTLSQLGLHWLIDAIEGFETHAGRNDLYWQLVAAMSAPILAARAGGPPVFVMLDDFDAAGSLYDSSLGDAHGLISLFGEAMQDRRCPHLMTGAAGALGALFTDHALLGMSERITLGPLPEELAIRLFRRHLEHLKVSCSPDLAPGFLSRLKGNPLYIRNLAKAAARMQKQGIAERDLVECYAYEVSEGETAFYWSAVFGRCVASPVQRRAMIRLLWHLIENGGAREHGRLSLVSGLSETETDAILDAIEAAGTVRSGNLVFQDYVRSLYMQEIEGKTPREAKERIEARLLAEESGSTFEFVIPMSSNAELVIARAVEQIGLNMELDPEFLNHLQLALIEVCINAMEHGGGYEKRVFLKVIARPSRLEIIIENEGKPFSLESLTEIPVEEKLRSGMRRGWGFKLVRSIMDSVKVERVNDRTRVILSKTLDDKEVHS